MVNKKGGDKLVPRKKQNQNKPMSKSFTPHRIHNFSLEDDFSEPATSKVKKIKVPAAQPAKAPSTATSHSQAKKPVGTKTGSPPRSPKSPQTRNPAKTNTSTKQQAKGKAGKSAPPSPLLVGKPTRRRNRGFRQSDVSGGSTQVLPNLSPQFSPEILRSKGRETESPPRLKASNQSLGPALKVIPLGGLCEIGKNMTIYEYENDMIIVDVGVAFPEEYQPGIDSVIPDMSYVYENRHKLRGIFFTHGHEDHIGSISWLLAQVSAPIYSRRMTCELLKLKLEDKGLASQLYQLHTVEADEIIKAGCFGVEFIHVNHSIADAAALAIRTPAGIVIHSGDFKIDYTPIHGEVINLQRFAELGSEGVLLFVCESTNVEMKGFSPSEKSVGESFADQFAKATGRIIVATFSSNVHRVQQIITAAEQHKRKVALAGRSMLNVFKAAQNLNYVDVQPGTLIELRDVDKYPPEQVVLITTGSQGEPMSALTRMAYSEHRNIEIGAGDTVIISASPIPGNEKPIYRVINELYKRQARVVYSSLAEIHASGHAYREEIKILHQLIKPQYFLPGHGEYRHLYMHAELAHEMGQPMESIYILNNGDIFECDADHARIAGYTTAGAVLIDGSPQSTVDSEVLDQRRILSDDGVVSISLAVDRTDTRLLGQPVIQTRGFIYEKDLYALQQECLKRISSFVEKAHQNGKRSLSTLMTSAPLRDQLLNMLYQRTSRRPVLLISVIEEK